MRNDEIIQKINEQITFLKNYLERRVKAQQNGNSTDLLLDLLIMLSATDKQEDYQYWLPIAKQYFHDFKPGGMFSEYDLIELEYYKYLLSVIAQNPNMDLAKKYCVLHSGYIQRNYKLNKTESDLYEEVVMSLLEAKEFECAYELIKKIQSIKERNILSIITEYSFKKKSDNQGFQIRKLKMILKRREGDPLVQKYPYYSYYYREMLKIDDAKEIFRGMVFGLD